jgi:hypothetical protein
VKVACKFLLSSWGEVARTRDAANLKCSRFDPYSLREGEEVARGEVQAFCLAREALSSADSRGFARTSEAFKNVLRRIQELRPACRLLQAS